MENKSGLDNLIHKVECKWLQSLYAYIEAEFSKKWLPSHDQTHHLRVWSYAKKLVEILHMKGHPYSEKKLEQLIIAVFFHDTGLTRTLDALHGKESRVICRDFLSRHASLSPVDVDQILEAVERHDDKSYTYHIPAGKDLPDDISTLLAVCDDLDAFGAIGVFRYLEIYLQRGTPLQSMSERVIENVNSRFINLKKHYERLEDFMQEQEKRCQFTADFYRELNIQLLLNPDLSGDIGPVAVVNVLRKEVLRKKIHFTDLQIYAKNLASDAYGRKYFETLFQELSLYQSKLSMS